MIVIADSSPLISFALINKLELLENIFGKLYVPKAVYKEVTIPNKSYSKKLQVFLESRVKDVRNDIAVKFLNNELGAGESEAIVLALEQVTDYIIIDDYKGRKIAATSKLKVIGTVGVLLRAKELNYITEVTGLLDTLIENKIRIGEKLYETALELSGELAQ